MSNRNDPTEATTKAGQAYLAQLSQAEREKLRRDVVRYHEEEGRVLWAQIVDMYQVKDLYAADVVDVLRAGYSPPPEALPILANMLAHEGLPLKSNGGRPKTELACGQIVRVVAEVAPEMLEAARDSGMGKQASKDWVRGLLGLSDGTIKAVARRLTRGGKQGNE